MKQQHLSESVKRHMVEVVTVLQDRNIHHAWQTFLNLLKILLCLYTPSIPRTNIYYRYFGKQYSFLQHYNIKLCNIISFCISGMIELIEIELPVNTQDFDRHSTSKTQYFKGKKFIYAPILPQLEAYLNFKNVENAVMERKKFNCTTLTMDWLSKQIIISRRKLCSASSSVLAYVRKLG